MPIVTFSVPDDVMQAFNATFAHQNKSAVIAELMREAVARAQRQAQHQTQHRQAVERILEHRKTAPKVSEAQFDAVRQAGRE